MTTQRFQPGDKVKVKPTSAAVLGLTTNATHTIAHVDDFGQIVLRGGSSYYHPSHFELVMRAVPDMPCYSLKDGEGDWWVYTTEDPAAEGYWYLLDDPAMMRDGSELGAQGIIDGWGIDAEGSSDAAVAEPEIYSLLDGEGDWWVFDAEADRWEWRGDSAGNEAPFYTHKSGFDAGITHLTDRWGIDAEPLPAVAGVEVYEPGNSTGPSLHFEAPAFQPGDRVKIVRTSATYASRGDADGMRDVGDEFTVTSVGTNLHGPFVKGDDAYWWHPADLEKVTDPAPLQPGDWVQVWAQVGSAHVDKDNEIIISVPARYPATTVYVRNDAIVRPSAGQVPPWVKPARCTSLWSDGVRLWQCDMEAGHDRALHDSAEGAASWRDEVAYGRVEVTER